MDKKTNRSVQPAAKGPASDSKKNQDGAGGKLWPRSGRRRESAGGSAAAKSELSRKPPQQRSTKSFDIKRPRPRGTSHTDSLTGRTETARLDEQYEAELGSVFLPGSKKQSLNHLLNFVYTTPSREVHNQGRHNTSKNRLILTRKHKYNKEHFLQANCQFVVNASGDYKQYMNNPDALVDWDLIEQVNIEVSDYPSCPICLYPPVAAKMTRCGHVYCWSCLLHYLSLSDKCWRKCPICYEAVHKKDLKSVISKQYKTFNIEDVITFRLMKRQKGSLITYPAGAVVRDDQVFTLSEIDTVDAYSKLLLANKDEILSIIDREDSELKLQKLENGDCPENCFIEEALITLNERRHRILTTPIDTSKEANQKVLNLKMVGKDEIGENVIMPDEGRSNHVAPASSPSKFHYFYQASDGQHIYLHAINARMLEHTYGCLQDSPETLTGKILEKEGGSMTEELRKRLRYLQHLPVTCQFEVAEIKLKQPIVNKVTLDHFYEQLEVRRKRRQKRAREEKKREKQIANEEDRMMGKYHAPNLHIESESQFPCFERARSDSEGTTTHVSEGSCLSTPSGSLTTEHEHNGPSFAKMLATAKKSDMKWPTLKEVTQPAHKIINVTGQKMRPASVISIKHDSESDAELVEFDTPSPPNVSLGDAIVQALQRVTENELPAEETQQGKKKKKKNKQKILFTTAVAYSGN